MQVIETALPGVLVVVPARFQDPRGEFVETYQEARYAALGVGPRFAQDNRSTSHRGVLRGMHFQQRIPQGKLVQVVAGRIFDVAADIRPGSSTFGKYVGVELSADNGHQVWIPPGFAHGFLALSEEAVVEYKCTAPYDPTDASGIHYLDPTLGIAWPEEASLVSDKDARLPSLSAISASLHFSGLQ